MSADTPSKASSWSRYWETAAGTAGCLPGTPAPVSAVIEGAWRHFFDSLEDGSRVLDLGTGGFAVPRLGRSVRPDLGFVGVDYAQALPPAPEGVEARAGVALEALPFEANSFDAVTSQFAIEYADRDKATAEVARVLKPGGHVMIVAHHSSGVIRHHNDARHAAICDMLADGGLVPAALEAKRAGLAAERDTHVRLDGILRDLQARHGKAGVVTEVLQLLAPMLLAPDGGPGLDLLAEDLAMEQQRLTALASASLDQVGAEALADALGAAAPVSAHTLSVEGLDQPVAWRLG